VPHIWCKGGLRDTVKRIEQTKILVTEQLVLLLQEIAQWQIQVVFKKDYSSRCDRQHFILRLLYDKI
jgi:hypothetical protein